MNKKYLCAIVANICLMQPSLGSTELENSQTYKFVSASQGECLQLKIASDNDPAKMQLETEVYASTCPDSFEQGSQAYWELSTFTRSGEGYSLKNEQGLYLDIAPYDTNLIFQDYKATTIFIDPVDNDGYQIIFDAGSDGYLCLTSGTGPDGKTKLTGQECDNSDINQVWDAQLVTLN